jgi:site-specific recombinase XerD
VLLGHRDIKTTQIYAEIDDARAREFILKIG